MSWLHKVELFLRRWALRLVLSLVIIDLLLLRGFPGLLLSSGSSCSSPPLLLILNDFLASFLYLVTLLHELLLRSLEDLRKLPWQVAALLFESVIVEYVVELLVDPPLISLVVKVDATGHIGESPLLGIFAFFGGGGLIRRGIWALDILDVLVVQGLAGFIIYQAIPGLVKFAWSHWSILEIIHHNLNCQQYHFAIETVVVLSRLDHAGGPRYDALLH